MTEKHWIFVAVFALPVAAQGLIAQVPAATTQRAPEAATAQTPPPNTLTDDEKLAGFKLLFDGTPAGWRQLGGKEFPAGWDINDASLHHKPKGGGGDITLNDTFDNFELRFDFKIAADGNSGLKYRVVEEANNHSALGIEFQVVDQNSATADNKGKHSLASLYDLVDAKVAQPKRAGEWNTGRVIVRGNHFEHSLNGTKVAELDYGTDAWKKAFAASKWAATYPTFAAQPKGHIILQDHNDEAWFRNIKIKILKAVSELSTTAPSS